MKIPDCVPSPDDPEERIKDIRRKLSDITLNQSLGFGPNNFVSLKREPYFRTESTSSISSEDSRYVPELVKQHFLDVENRLFEMFGNKESNTININKFLGGLLSTGLRDEDPRLQDMKKNLKVVQERVAQSDLDSLNIDFDTFMGIISNNLEIIVKAFSYSFVIPDFKHFCDQVDTIYHGCKTNTSGKPAQYIPQLARLNPNHWGVSICTVDGQRYSCGDVQTPFTLQSCGKPVNYAIASGEYGTEFVHKYVGMEPSGRYFNELCLDHNNKPHNPMINAGAIMTSSLLKPNYSAADRFDHVFSTYKRLVGGEYLGFNNAVFLSERECADRNFALAYFMRENKCFPDGTKLHETLDFYFQLCSLEITSESGSIIAATLANGGINPLTGDPVLTMEAVRNTLTLMHSCGMYNYSGQFAFKVGLPAKSGVSGCILLVVPNTLGICLWSPNLDQNGNSCRGVQFCKELVTRFKFHHFDNLRGNVSCKIDPRMAKNETRAQILFDLLFSVAAGDLSALRRHALAGSDMEAGDYDGRTALHVATSEGHTDLVAFLLAQCNVHPAPRDRWGRTPLDDAISFSHPRCAQLVESYMKKRGIAVNSTTSKPSIVSVENLPSNTMNILYPNISRKSSITHNVHPCIKSIKSSSEVTSTDSIVKSITSTSPTPPVSNLVTEDLNKSCFQFPDNTNKKPDIFVDTNHTNDLDEISDLQKSPSPAK